MVQNIEVKIFFQNDNSKYGRDVKNRKLEVSIDGKNYQTFDELPFDIKLRVCSELDLWHDSIYEDLLKNG